MLGFVSIRKKSGWAIADHLRAHISVQSEINFFLMNILVSELSKSQF